LSGGIGEHEFVCLKPVNGSSVLALHGLSPLLFQGHEG
jgi:hypothetical protein